MLKVFSIPALKDNYIYVEDLGNQSVKALEKGATNKIITLVPKKSTKIIDLAKIIIKLIYHGKS